MQRTLMIQCLFDEYDIVVATPVHAAATVDTFDMWTN